MLVKTPYFIIPISSNCRSRCGLRSFLSQLHVNLCQLFHRRSERAKKPLWERLAFDFWDGPIRPGKLPLPKPPLLSVFEICLCPCPKAPFLHLLHRAPGATGGPWLQRKRPDSLHSNWYVHKQPNVSTEGLAGGFLGKTSSDWVTFYQRKYATA